MNKADGVGLAALSFIVFASLAVLIYRSARSDGADAIDWLDKYRVGQQFLLAGACALLAVVAPVLLIAQ